MANPPQKRAHKAATDVTVAPLEERSGIEELAIRYWKPAIGVFAVIAVLLMYRSYEQKQAAATNDHSWQELSRYLGFIEQPGTAPDVAGLEKAAIDLEGTLAGPWAAALLAPAYVEIGDYGKADQALQSFRTKYPHHPLVDPALGGDESGASGLADRLKALEDLKSSRPELFDNPPPPSDAPRVRLNTSAGPITVALYPERAPGHVENFLDKVAAGNYSGTKFHRVMDGFMIQGGDPNSIDGDPSTWGQGGGEVTQPQEFSDLGHFPGYLSMAKRPDQVDSSTYQFFLTLGSPHHLDGVHTVFGKVVEGMETVEAIGKGEIVEGTDRPVAPVTIESAEIIG
ncbi:peptidylprolyl isomerase [Engelhardtia mirabilis]|uniref:peptidylprolyl isomerase n=1 Tax=Engelhardtia mirabilis TaxID=2528011 RepID=A0A518BT15_9BACT|nr:Peptidyl-prolyl cis-trans isomerase cyp18 [Planctomycetes bacterium Pla133]QDV04435.1 Peptidyl-prolyl cis-trans isomerase cyp18 [Planctomycetes bacterium Pla86]